MLPNDEKKDSERSSQDALTRQRVLDARLIISRVGSFGQTAPTFSISSVRPCRRSRSHQRLLSATGGCYQPFPVSAVAGRLLGKKEKLFPVAARFFNETSRLIFRRDLAGLGGPGNGQGMADLGGEAASLSLEHRARLAGSQYR